jgi:hypothetical protein
LLGEVQVECITEERASRCIQRIDLLDKVRHDVLENKNFDDWITNCLPSVDLPDWWIVGKHDSDLVKAAARYGITRTEFYYTNDADLSFKDDLIKYLKHVERLMVEDQLPIEPTPGMIDPIQYYFQNQGRIQLTYRDLYDDKEETESLLKSDEYIQKCCFKVLNQIVNDLEKDDPLNKSFSAQVDNGSIGIPLILWPKDRIIINRLEAIIILFENNGEWPKRNLFPYPTPQQALQQQQLCMNSSSPFLPSNSLSVSNLISSPSSSSLIGDRRMMIPSPVGDSNSGSLDGDNGENNGDSQNDYSDTPTTANPVSSKKTKRGRSSAFGRSSDNSMPLSPLVQSSNTINDDYQRGNSSKSNRSRLSDNNDKKDTNGRGGKPAGFLEPGEIMRPVTKSTRPSRTTTQQQQQQHDNDNVSYDESEQEGGEDSGESFQSSNKRKNRKSSNHPTSASSSSATTTNNNNNNTHESMSHEMMSQFAAMADALGNENDAGASLAAAAMFLQSGQNPDERISVINLENGQRLTGNKAPKRADLLVWLMSHPNFTIDQSEFMNLLKNNNNGDNGNNDDSSNQDDNKNNKLSKLSRQQQQQASVSSSGRGQHREFLQQKMHESQKREEDEQHHQQQQQQQVISNKFKFIKSK